MSENPTSSYEGPERSYSGVYNDPRQQNVSSSSQNLNYRLRLPDGVSDSRLDANTNEFFPKSNGAVRKRIDPQNKFRYNTSHNQWRNRYVSGGTPDNTRLSYVDRNNSEDHYEQKQTKFRNGSHQKNYKGFYEENLQELDPRGNASSSSSKYFRNTKKYEHNMLKPTNNHTESHDYIDEGHSYRKKSINKRKHNFHNQKENSHKSDYDLRSSYKSYDSRGNQKFGNMSTKNNWRSEREFSQKYNGLVKTSKESSASSQRERLVEMLSSRMLECLICCEKVKNTDKVWSCFLCYHIFHFKCVVAWATSSKIENGWRCPACQNVYNEVPNQYRCYCSKTIEPKYEPGLLPHSCGEMCLRKGRNCDHKCSSLCHPGPCPDCTIMMYKNCGCGSTKQMVKCSTEVEIVCDSNCNKFLECGIHHCQQLCHPGDCQICKENIVQQCYCEKNGRTVSCCAKYSRSNQYSCGEICNKLLSCGHHHCQNTCHEGPCVICPMDVTIVKTCPCGKTPLSNPRSSCLDPINSCNKICSKVLQCGQPNSPHSCRNICHEGVCLPCPLSTIVKCRCGHMDKEIACEELTTKADDARCLKKCTKKRLCGKHKCHQFCCIELEHVCPLPCNRLLSCGLHRCERTCHSGHCPPCQETSFEELFCECGDSVIFPPVPCGTKPPNCNQFCSRPRSCGHSVNHKCHTGPCPPCSILCQRWCYGRHEKRSTIPCYQENFSCGLPCGKDMLCRKHKCVKPCHEGSCPMPCKQPCTIPRELCGHECGKPCHERPCPESNCKQLVTVTCQCNLQKGTRPCTEVIDEFKNIQMAQLKDKMGNLCTNASVDLSEILSVPKKPVVLKILECTEECHVLDRNRRLAIGLQIRNPDLSQKLTPRYSDFMRQWAKKDPHFCQRIHDKVTELVHLAKNSKQKSRSYSFESMNRDKRRFLHEYCEHFGVESAAYDMEPNRNIVATACKDKSWLPSMSLLEVIQRENGQRRVPGPVLGRASNNKTESTSLKLPSRGQRLNTNEITDHFKPL